MAIRFSLPRSGFSLLEAPGRDGPVLCSPGRRSLSAFWATVFSFFRIPISLSLPFFFLERCNVWGGPRHPPSMSHDFHFRHDNTIPFPSTDDYKSISASPLTFVQSPQIDPGLSLRCVPVLKPERGQSGLPLPPLVLSKFSPSFPGLVEDYGEVTHDRHFRPSKPPAFFPIANGCPPLVPRFFFCSNQSVPGLSIKMIGLPERNARLSSGGISSLRSASSRPGLARPHAWIEPFPCPGNDTTFPPPPPAPHVILAFLCLHCLVVSLCAPRFSHSGIRLPFFPLPRHKIPA